MTAEAFGKSLISVKIKVNNFNKKKLLFIRKEKLYFFFLIFSMGALFSGCGGPRDFESPGGRTLAPKNSQSKPYCISNSFHRHQWFYPQHHYELTEEGMASYYGQGDAEHGGLTATGEVYDKYMLTAAHRTLPLPCVIMVTNLKNGRSVKLKVNDRGPFAKNRILDVSVQAAKALGFYGKGTAPIRLQTIVGESLALGKAQEEGARSKKEPLLLAKTSKKSRWSSFAQLAPDKKLETMLLAPSSQSSRSLPPSLSLVPTSALEKIAQPPSEQSFCLPASLSAPHLVHTYIYVYVSSLSKALLLEEAFKAFGPVKMQYDKKRENAGIRLRVGPVSWKKGEKICQKLKDYPVPLRWEMQKK